MCLFFNFWMIKFTIMCFFDIHTWNFSTKVLYMSKKHTSLKKYTNWAKLSHFWGKCVFWHVEDLSWEIPCVNVKRNHNCEFYHSKIEKQTHFPQKIYKLSNPKSCDPEFRIFVSNQKMSPKVSGFFFPKLKKRETNKKCVLCMS